MRALCNCLSQDDLDRLIAIRRDLHAHPELSLREARTAGVVASYLRDCGLEVFEGVGGHGVVATARGAGTRAPIGLRADMDALAIQEQSGDPHASRHAGVMHACGHDGHTTMLLGAARVISRMERLPRDVHFIFQPAEEQHGGAARMVADGLFDRFPMEAVYGLHIEPDLPIGQFATRPGPMMAAAAVFRVLMRGPGGHGGADPYRSADLTLAQAEFVTGLQAVIRREVDATQPVVLTVGHVGGGDFDAPNVMPTTMRLSGTMRCFDPDVCDTLTERLHDFGRSIARLHRCEVETEVVWEATPLINSPIETEIALKAARSVAGAERVSGAAALTMGAEDFADMLRVRPGAYILLGNAGEKPSSRAALHTPVCDFNDDAIPYGVGYWVALATEQDD